MALNSASEETQTFQPSVASAGPDDLQGPLRVAVPLKPLQITVIETEDLMIEALEKPFSERNPDS